MSNNVSYRVLEDLEALELLTESRKESNIYQEIKERQECTYHEEWVSCLYLMVDGIPVRELGSEGGEPEDQTFGRDWFWVAKELNTAYRLGVLHEMAKEK